MARAHARLIAAIRTAADQIEQGNHYEWGHMGGCNCGHLAQNLTQLSRADIHRYAMQKGTGDWSEQVETWCDASGMDMDLLISELLGHGLSREDLIHLERLSDRAVLELLPSGVTLERNQSHHAALYMRTWAGKLETELA